jgi:hypothetical protein
MKTLLISLILTGLFFMPATYAQGNFAGVSYAQLESEDVETGNLVLAGGHITEKGIGFEVFYALTVSEDSLSTGPFSADITLDSFGILAVYKTPTDVYDTYLKVKGGFAKVDLEFDFGDIGKLSDNTSGFAFGIAIGTRVGPGALEFSYMVLPEFDEFEGLDIDAEVDMLSLGYLWDF